MNPIIAQSTRNFPEKRKIPHGSLARGAKRLKTLPSADSKSVRDRVHSATHNVLENLWSLTNINLDLLHFLGGPKELKRIAPTCRAINIASQREIFWQALPKSIVLDIFFRALPAQQAEVVKLLMIKNHVPSIHQATSLLQAYKDRHNNTINTLLAAGNIDWNEIPKPLISDIFCKALDVGHIALAKILLKTGKISPHTICQKACETGHIDLVTDFLTFAQNLDDARNTAFYYAVAYGHLALVQTLLHPPGSIEQSSLISGLLDAVSNGQQDMVTTLLQTGLISLTDQADAFQSAAAKGSLDVLEAFPVDAMDAKLLKEALFAACWAGHLHIVQRILATNQISPEDQGIALQDAVTKGHLQIVNSLYTQRNIALEHVHKARNNRIEDDKIKELLEHWEKELTSHI